MKIQAVLAFAALVAAVPFEGGPLQKRAPPREFIGYRIVQPVGRIDYSENHIA
jgi:hypothetical protein